MALLSLALSASLWWTYFSDEEAVEPAMLAASPERRAQLALWGFGYWHYGLILGVVGVAAGLKKAIGDPYDPLDAWIALELAAGAALFIACDAGFRRTLGVARSALRLVAAAASLLTIPVGTELSAAAQVGALAAIMAAALVAEASRRASRSERPGVLMPPS
jgi:low temperature requirement protein LtrA